MDVKHSFMKKRVDHAFHINVIADGVREEVVGCHIKPSTLTRAKVMRLTAESSIL